jgi:hypothetical protein
MALVSLLPTKSCVSCSEVAPHLRDATFTSLLNDRAVMFSTAAAASSQPACDMFCDSLPTPFPPLFRRSGPHAIMSGSVVTSTDGPLLLLSGVTNVVGGSSVVGRVVSVAAGSTLRVQASSVTATGVFDVAGTLTLEATGLVVPAGARLALRPYSRIQAAATDTSPAVVSVLGALVMESWFQPLYLGHVKLLVHGVATLGVAGDLATFFLYFQRSCSIDLQPGAVVNVRARLVTVRDGSTGTLAIRVGSASALSLALAVPAGQTTDLSLAKETEVTSAGNVSIACGLGSCLVLVKGMTMLQGGTLDLGPRVSLVFQLDSGAGVNVT